MKKLLNTLYVTSSEAYLALDGDNVVARIEQQELMRVPLLNLEGIVTFGYAGASPALMGAATKQGVSLTFCTPSGQFLARVSGNQQGNVLLRKNQYRFSDDLGMSAHMAKYFLSGKLYNARWVIERATRDHAMRLDCAKLKAVSQSIYTAGKELLNCQTLEEIRGIEGAAANRYFSVFDDLILQQKDGFVYKGRSRRPPLDNINALLSFVYMLLTNELCAALECVGLDPYVGFLHRDRPGRPSLALDMLEALRPLVCDRFVLTLVNKKVVQSSGFIQQPGGGVRMDDKTNKAILTAWQEKNVKHLSTRS